MNSKNIRRRTVSGCAAIVLGVMTLPAMADISFTPRIGIYFDNTDQRESQNVKIDNLEDQEAFADIRPYLTQLGGNYFVNAQDSVKRSTPLAIPQFGGTLTFDWRGDSATQLAFTALYGEANSDQGTQVNQQYATFNLPNGAPPFTLVPLRFTDSSVYTAKYEGKSKRLDLEATVQHRLNETFSLIAGVRFERREGDFDALIQGTYSQNFYNFIVDYANRLSALVGQPAPFTPFYTFGGPPITARQTVEFNTYSARFGAAAYAPVGEKHLFYVNGLLQVSRTEGGDTKTTYSTGVSEVTPGLSDTAIGPDISVGYMYRLSDRFGFDVRYRATVYFPVQGPYDFEDARVNHGVGVGFTTWFGGR